ncbi:MAG: calcium/sodium antiporter [Candidatus Marinimicrobia bacterium]|nr:calcium/sodium antiporter [Candidatus Neomarinimicrobiota bacterium]
MILQALLFIFGFALLIKGGDFLVEGASALAKSFRVSDLVIGLTVVSFGTSAPELLVNIYASFSAAENIAFGNVLGSNVANIFLVLGIAAMLRPLSLQWRTVWKEIPFAFIIVIVFAALANDSFILEGDTNILSRLDGFVLLIFFSGFMYYSWDSMIDDEILEELPQISRWKSSLMVFAGIIALGIGGKLVVDSASQIAENVGISDAFIGLTIVAFGTSLPELVTSITAGLKQNSDIAVGNIVGSNIFNIAFVLGVSASINPIPYALSFNTDVIFVLLATALLFGWMFVGEKYGINRIEGGIFFLIYVIYIFVLYNAYS